MPIRSHPRRAILAGVAGLVLSHTPADAHAILESSEPKSGGAIPPGRTTLKLRFNSRIDRGRSGLTLTRIDQTQGQTQGQTQSRTRTSLTIDPEGSPDILTSTVTLTPGAYVLRWQVLAVDGHITRGDVAFTVGGN